MAIGRMHNPDQATVTRAPARKAPLPPPPSGRQAPHPRRLPHLHHHPRRHGVPRHRQRRLIPRRAHASVCPPPRAAKRLAPRTERLLTHLDKTFRIIIATDMKMMDPRSRERVKDVLTEMHRSSGNLEYLMIDTGSAGGMDDYKRLLRELVTRDDKLVKEQSASIDLAGGAALSLSGYLNDTLSPALLDIQNGISPSSSIGQTNRAYFEQAAAASRVLAKDLSTAAGKASDELRSHLDDIAIPATDKASAALVGILSAAVDQLTELAKQLETFASSPAAAGPAADLAKPLVKAVEQRRDQAAVMLDSLRRMRPPRRAPHRRRRASAPTPPWSSARPT